MDNAKTPTLPTPSWVKEILDKVELIPDSFRMMGELGVATNRIRQLEAQREILITKTRDHDKIVEGLEKIIEERSQKIVELERTLSEMKRQQERDIISADRLTPSGKYPKAKY